MLMNRLQVVFPFALCLSVAILCSGCGGADGTRTPASSVQPMERNDRTQFHPAETAAEDFLSIFSGDELPNPLPKIPVLSKLKDDARDEALQSLGQYLRSQRWTLWFTELVVSGGREDVATCFFKGSAHEQLVLMLAYHENAWIVSAYEIPAKSWARAKSESLEEYVNRMVAEAKEQGTSFHNGPLTDGLYLLER